MPVTHKLIMEYKNNLFVLPLIIMVVLLIGFAIAGFHSRYLADDYCYDAEFITHGFWKGQIHSYINDMTYSPNRYSLTFFSGVAWLLGGFRLAPFLPFLVILLWVAALFYFLNQAFRLIRMKKPFWTVLFFAALIPFFTLLIAPNRYEIIYWRSGMLPYLAPIISTIWLGGRFLYFQQRSKNNIGTGLELGLLSFISAGFSETAFAVQAGLWGVVFLFVLVQRKQGTLKLIIPILIGLLLGSALLMLSPSNDLRQSRFPIPPSLPVLFITSIGYARDFFIYSFRATPLPFLTVTMMGFLLGWLYPPALRIGWKTAIIIPVALILVTFLLIIGIMAPTVYTMSVYASPRSLFIGDFLFVLLSISLGFWAGIIAINILKTRISPGIVAWTPLLFVILFSAYSIRFIPHIYALIPSYQVRAQLWDERNEFILKAQIEGNMQPVVPGIDSIAQIYELQTDQKHYVNACAADYYGLDAIISAE